MDQMLVRFSDCKHRCHVRETPDVLKRMLSK